jgi:hypothetical protein
MLDENSSSGNPTPRRPTASLPPRRDLGDFARRVVVALLLAALIVSLTVVIWRGFHVVLEAFAGVLFAIFLSALSQWLSKHPASPTAGH